MKSTGGQTGTDAPDGLVMTTLDIDKHAQALADMWNASDANWPGTWTRGVPETAEKVRREYERSEAIETFVCVDGEVLAGFCKVSPDHDEPSVDYVALVNVPPSHQKRGVARRLLQRATALAVERGSYRLDLHTWSANLNAVPLYKKCGFMWMPDTDLHMLNFIPAVLRLDAAKEFFSTRDWYEVFRRPLDQVPDDERWEGMKVFTYRFVNSADDPPDAAPGLVVRVDREARAICAVETQSYAVAATSARADAPRGGEAKVRWTVTNKSEAALPVTVVASGGSSLLIDYRGSAEVAPGGTATLEAPCRVAADAPDVKRHMPVPAIKSVLLLGTEVIDLSTGLRPRPALEITTWPARVTVAPGTTRKVEVRLRNRLDTAAEVDLRVTPGPGLDTSWSEQRFSLDAEGWSSAALEVTAATTESAALPLSISATATSGGTSLRVDPEPRHVFAVAPGAVVAAHEKECLRIENVGLRLILGDEGAPLSIVDPSSGQSLGGSGALIGPPIWPSEFFSLTSALSLERKADGVTAFATATSKRWPGIVFRRGITVNSSPLVELSADVENRGPEPRPIQLNHWARTNFGNTHTLPLRSGFRQAEGWHNFPGPSDDHFKSPESWAERWMALEDTRDGRVIGVVWGPDVEECNQYEFLTRSTELQPQSRWSFDPLWLYCGPGSWSVVRDLWRRREGIVVDPDAPRPRISGLVSARVEPSPWLVSDDSTSAALLIEHGATWALTGAAHVVLPHGWTVAANEVDLSGVKLNSPVRLDLEVRPPAGPATAAIARVEIRDPEFDDDLEIPILHLPDGAVEVGAVQASGQQVWRVSNGVAEFDVGPEFGGATLALRLNGVDQLASPFPEPGSIGWFLPWHGGIAPILSSGETSFPGPIWKETFEAEAVSDKDGRGLVWKGVRLSAAASHEDARGLHIEVSTLTLAEAPLIKHVVRVRNESPSLRSALAGSLIFVAPGGERDGTHLYSEGMHVKPSDKVAWNATGTWAAAVNGKNGAAVLAASELDVGTIRFGLDGGHLASYRSLELPARSSKEIVTYLVAAESLEAALPWRSLTDLG